MPGTSPIRASSPKRIPVPGMTSAVSSNVARESMRAIRSRRERQSTNSNGKVALAVLAMADRWERGRQTQARQGHDYAKGNHSFRLTQEREQQLGHCRGLLLLHPVAGTLDQVESQHAGAGTLPHRLRHARELIGTPVALAA